MFTGQTRLRRGNSPLIWSIHSALLNFLFEINMAPLNNALQNTRQSRNNFFFIHSAHLTLTSACLKDAKKKKTEWTTHKHACSSKFPDLVLTEITTTFLNLTLLRACYFRHTIGSLTRFVFLTKILRLILWVLGSLMTCAFMASSLRLSACFIYDKRA